MEKTSEITEKKQVLVSPQNVQSEIIAFRVSNNMGEFLQLSNALIVSCIPVFSSRLVEMPIKLS